MGCVNARHTLVEFMLYPLFLMEYVLPPSEWHWKLIAIHTTAIRRSTQCLAMLTRPTPWRHLCESSFRRDESSGGSIGLEAFKRPCFEESMP